MNARLVGLSLSLSLALVAACDHTCKGPGNPAPAPSVAPSGAASAASSAAPAAPSASASASAVASAAASSVAPLVVPATWTPYANAKLGFSLSYPADTFRLAETPTAISFASALSRDELGENPKPKKWVYGLRVSLRADTPVAVLKKDYEGFYKSAFPGGKFKETESISALKLAGKDGYQLVMGVEGYNSRVLFLAKGASSTLVLDFRSIGGVMGPSVPEDQQVEVFDKMLLSFKMD
jgi:hypothetical protein